MSNWIAITIDTMHEAKVAKLVDACSTKAKAVGQPDRAPGIIQGVVDEIRRKVASCHSNRVDADLTTVPKGLRDLAVDMIMSRLKNALELPDTDAESTRLALHERTLNRIADCKDVIDQPDAPVTAPVESTTPTPSFGKGRPRFFTRRTQDGI